MPPAYPSSTAPGFTDRGERKGQGGGQGGYHRGYGQRMGRGGSSVPAPRPGEQYGGSCARPTEVVEEAEARNWGHLKTSALETSLLPAQKDVLAMSRAQFFAYLRASSAALSSFTYTTSPTFASSLSPISPTLTSLASSPTFPSSTSSALESAGGGGGGGGGVLRRTAATTTTTTATVSDFPDGIGIIRGGGQIGNGSAGNGGREGNGVRVNGLLVGVCIFRLDRETLRPAVLLVRRSPRWWARRDRCVFTTTRTTRTIQRQKQGQGQREMATAERWELPGGKVVDDDFCISAAVDRLVWNMLGLRVTKIMVMLSNMAWSAEVKVLLWDGEEDSEGNEGDDEGGGGGGGGGASPLSDWTDYGDDDESGNNGNAGWRSSPTAVSTSVYSNEDQEREELRAASLPSPSTSPWPWSLLRASASASDSNSNSISSPPLPPRRYGRDHERRPVDGEYRSRIHTRVRSSGNNSNNETLAYPDDSGSEHDPSLEPAPLSVPSQMVNTMMGTTVRTRTRTRIREETTGGRGGEERGTLSRTRGRSRTRTRSITAFSATLSTYDGGPSGAEGLDRGASSCNIRRRDAQVIPYKLVRRVYMQLNFGVIVDEDSRSSGNYGHYGHYSYSDNNSRGSVGGGVGRREGGLSSSSPHGFPISLGNDSGSNRKRDEEDDGVVDLEWATCARVREMDMSEDLRRVVLEGLDWMAGLTGRFF